MNVHQCPRARADVCCTTSCTRPAAYDGFTSNRGRLVEHQRCAAHAGDLDQQRMRHHDARWKAVNA